MTIIIQPEKTTITTLRDISLRSCVPTSRAIRNYILLKTAERLKILYKQKEYLYLLVIISEDPISYRYKVIYIKTKPVELRIKGRRIITNFNILPLEKDKVVLGIP